jgi:hypothetical protein
LEMTVDAGIDKKSWAIFPSIGKFWALSCPGAEEHRRLRWAVAQVEK